MNNKTFSFKILEEKGLYFTEMNNHTSIITVCVDKSIKICTLTMITIGIHSHNFPVSNSVISTSMVNFSGLHSCICFLLNRRFTHSVH